MRLERERVAAACGESRERGRVPARRKDIRLRGRDPVSPHVGVHFYRIPMSPIGHCAIALASRPAMPRVPLTILVVAAVFADVLAAVLVFAGIEGSPAQGAPWSHGLFMSGVWSILGGLLVVRAYRSTRAGIVVALLIFSHWVLDFISHPIPFNTFSWSSWSWSYGHPLPSDLTLFFSGSPRLGLGLYNAISAAQATALEVGMFLAGAAVYARWRVRQSQSRPKCHDTNSSS